MIGIEYYIKFFSFAKKILNSDEIFDVYIGISKSHKKSALEAIEAASKRPYVYSNWALKGLILCVLETARENRTVRWYEWLDDKINEYSSCDDDHKHMYKDLFKIAAMISYGHKLLEETDNEKRWKEKALNDFKGFAGKSKKCVDSPRYNGRFAEPASKGGKRAVIKSILMNRDYAWNHI